MHLGARRCALPLHLFFLFKAYLLCPPETSPLETVEKNNSQNYIREIFPKMFLHPFCFFSRRRERERETEREEKLNSSQQFIILQVVRKVDHSQQLKPFFQMDTGGHMLPRVKLVRRNWPCCSSCLTRMFHRRTSALL